MASGRWIQHPITLELVPADEYVRPAAKSAFVIPDIQPYRSMIDGSVIKSRSRHRTHLREHGCIEVGNETKALLNQGNRDKADRSVRAELTRATYDVMRKHGYAG